MRRSRVVTALTAGILLAGTALAQQQQPRTTQDRQTGQQRQPQTGQAQPGQTQGTQQHAGQQGQHDRQIDTQVANCMILSNQAEIAIARFAEGKAKNAKVKELAEALVRDHQQLNQRLQRFGTYDGSTDLTAADGQRVVARRPIQGQQAPEQQTPGGRTQPERQQASAQQQQGQHSGQESTLEQLFNIERQAAQDAVRMVKEELGKKQGDKFDKAFLAQQFGMHMAMVAKLKAARDHVSPELQQVINEELQITERHKEKARELLREIAGEDA